MPVTVPSDRILSLDCQKAFGRLRGLLRHQSVQTIDIVAQARECGRAAHAAEVRLDTMVDVLAGLSVGDAALGRSLQESLIHAAVVAYLAAEERASDIVGA